MKMAARSAFPQSFSTRKLLTHPTLPLSHTQDALMPQVVRNCFRLCWRRPQRNWMRQCEAASIALFWFLYLLSTSSLDLVSFCFSFFYRSEFLKWNWHRKAGSKIWILVVHRLGQLRFKSNSEKFEYLLHARIHLGFMGMADLHLCSSPM